MNSVLHVLQCTAVMFGTLELRGYFALDVHENHMSSNSRCGGQFAEAFAGMFKKFGVMVSV